MYISKRAIIDTRNSLADISKAKNLLGYTPSVLLPEGLKRTFEWFRKSAIKSN